MKRYLLFITLICSVICRAGWPESEETLKILSVIDCINIGNIKDPAAIIEAAVKNGGDMNAHVSLHGYKATPLWLALKIGNKGLAKFLLESGADCTVVSPCCQPLFWSVKDASLAQLFIERLSRIDARDSRQNCILHELVLPEYPLELLYLYLGCLESNKIEDKYQFLNGYNYYGNAPLHRLIECIGEYKDKEEELFTKVSLLIKSGVDPYKKTRNGHAPFGLLKVYQDMFPEKTAQLYEAVAGMLFIKKK